MTRVVVTGSSGKAGRACIRDLLAHGYEVANVDLLPPAEPVCPFSRVDLTDIGEGKMSFNPQLSTSVELQLFCPGDSGGPVFAGRYRGCKATDRAREPQPHLLQGVVSYYVPGPEDDGSSTLGSCHASALQVMQDITTPEHRAWICRNTNGEANGCDLPRPAGPGAASVVHDVGGLASGRS